MTSTESNPTAQLPRIFVWGSAGQVDLIQSIQNNTECEITTIGGPAPDDSAALSNTLSVDRVDDFRVAIQDENVDMILLTAPDPLKTDESRLIRDRDIPAFTTEPRPGSIADMALPTETETAIFTPRMRYSTGFQAALQVLDDFGECQSINIAMRCGNNEGTLFARLFDTMDIALHLCGESEQLGASLTADSIGVPESLHQLNGHLTLNMRFPNGASGSVSLSNKAGRWFRGVTIIGEGGCLRIGDNSFEWIGPDGTILDAHNDETDHSPGSLIGRHITRYLQHLNNIVPENNTAVLLALCEATRLSCKTGQIETPGKMLEMLSKP